jgi:hypothetical protein
MDADFNGLGSLHYFGCGFAALGVLVTFSGHSRQNRQAGGVIPV